MKIAIVHDDLMRRGGAEQVALALHKTFPDAPIYTLCYQPEFTYPEFKDANVITSIYQKFVRTEQQMKLFFYPFGFWAMRLLSIKGYDKVILSSTYASKYADFEQGVEVINYCHNPFRLAWYPESYESYSQAGLIKKLIFKLVISQLKRLDWKYSNKCNRTIVNSKLVAQRVKHIYGIEPTAIINPPVNLDNFMPYDSVDKENNYLVVSRLESYKKVDLVIEAFNINRKALTIVGSGSQEGKLKGMANSNILFKSGLSKEEIANEYATAKALIFPQVEDFGITPLEANASGTPVIAYGEGGVLETIVPFPDKHPTGIFFNEQTPDCLNESISKFETNFERFQVGDMLANARKFSMNRFQEKIRSMILN